MALARSLRLTLLAHPEMTEKMMYGNLNAEVLPILKVSLRKLHGAGFRHYAPQVYTMVLNTILWIITARNLHSPTRGKQRHDLNQMVVQMQVLTTKSPTLTEMVQNYFVPLTDLQSEGQMDQEYFDLMVESMLAGLKITVLPRETDAWYFSVFSITKSCTNISDLGYLRYANNYTVFTLTLRYFSAAFTGIKTSRAGLSQSKALECMP